VRHKLALCFALISLVLLLAPAASAFSAQQKSTSRPVKLPSAEKVVDGTSKPSVERKRVTAIRDASHEWAVTLGAQPMGLAKNTDQGAGFDPFRNHLWKWADCLWRERELSVGAGT
jgi:hypothetical protein